MAMINCPECDREISSKAASCPHCGIPLKETQQPVQQIIVNQPKKKSRGCGCLIAICILVAIIIIGVVIAISTDDSTTKTIIDAANSAIMGKDGKLTLEKFEKIKTGMTYKQVCDIIGEEGELMSEVDLDIGKEYQTEIYSWYGSGSFGANMNATFQGGKLVSKAQIGLK